MTSGSARTVTRLLAPLMAAQAASGLLLPGAYHDPAWIRAAWLANDVVTLCLAVPLLLVATWLHERGSVRASLLLAGTLGYAVYNYAFYLLGAELNAVFPLYVVLVVHSASAFSMHLRGMAGQGLHELLPTGSGVRLAGALLAVIGALLTIVWVSMWAAYAFAGVPTPVAPDFFRLVAALDLTLMVPAMVGGGVLLFRRRAWGLVVAAAAAVQGAMYLLVLTAGSAISVHRGLVAPPGEVYVWGPLMMVVGAAATTLVLADTRGGATLPAPGHARRSAPSGI